MSQSHITCVKNCDWLLVKISTKRICNHTMWHPYLNCNSWRALKWRTLIIITISLSSITLRTTSSSSSSPAHYFSRHINSNTQQRPKCFNRNKLCVNVFYIYELNDITTISWWLVKMIFFSSRPCLLVFFVLITLNLIWKLDLALWPFFILNAYTLKLRMK